MKEYNYKFIHIYADHRNTLYAIPTGFSQKLKTETIIDIINILELPYSDEDISNLVFKTFFQCYTKERAEEDDEPCSIAKHFAVKTYPEAVRGLKLLIADWTVEEGYSIISTSKIKRRGYVHLEDKIKMLGFDPKPGEIAVAIRQAIEESTTY